MTTLGMRARAVNAAWRSPVREEISAKVLPCISLMSAPAAKTFGPPQSTTAPTRSSPLTTPAASCSSSWTCALRAFTGGRSLEAVQGRVDPVLPAGRAAAGQLGALLPLDLLADAEDLQLLVVVGDVLVHAHDHLGALLHLLLVGEGGVGHLLLEPPLLDAGQHPLQHGAVAEPVDGGEQLLRAPLLQVGHLLHKPGAPQRVDRGGHAGLLGDHLLGPQRNRRGPLG